MVECTLSNITKMYARTQCVLLFLVLVVKLYYVVPRVACSYALLHTNEFTVD